MSAERENTSWEFEKALEIGRPPNIVRLFPNSRALIVSGKVIDRALIEKGKAMTIAANGRNHFVVRGALQAAQRANAAIIIEIAKSEGGPNAYCASNFWNLARQVDAVCNELGITVPVAIHADHYGIDPNRIVALGGSSGGITAIMLAISDPEDYSTDYPGGQIPPENHPNESSAVQACLEFWGTCFEKIRGKPPEVRIFGFEEEFDP